MSQVEETEDERLMRLAQVGNKPFIMLSTLKKGQTGRDARASATSRVRGGQKALVSHNINGGISDGKK